VGGLVGAVKFFETAKIEAAWAKASARASDAPRPPAIASYVDELGSLYGSVVYVELELSLDAALAALATDAENWKYSRLLERLWDLGAVAAALPPLPRRAEDLAGHFFRVDLFDLAAFLGRTLHQGGAYSTGTERSAALALGSGAARELLDGAEGAYLSESAWCGFFHDVAWDRSVVVLPPGRVRILLASDSD
jgi:hypothetical protein